MFPNQQSWGHARQYLRRRGGEEFAEPGRRGAVSRVSRQRPGANRFADGNNEWPTVKSVKVANRALDSMGPFKAETVPVAQVGMNQIKVQQILDRVASAIPDEYRR